MNIIEAIHARHSVRTFSGEPLQAAVKKALEEAINNSRSPFEGNVTMRLASVGIGEEFRPSTYGVIRNALDFLLLGFANDKWSAVSGGFRMEQVVLEATRLGLGTCWVGGTFKKGSFAKAADLPEGQTLRSILPVGEAARRTGFLDKILRMAARSYRRRPFGELFFVNNFNTPLPEDGPYAGPLALMRLAPSATNSQPWRALVHGNQVDFYYKPGNFSLIDMGIGLCHFDIGCHEENMTGMFAVNNLPEPAPEDFEYLISYIQA